MIHEKYQTNIRTHDNNTISISKNNYLSLSNSREIFILILIALVRMMAS